MQDLKLLDYTIVTDFLTKAFDLGVELCAFEDHKFSVNAVIEQIILNGFTQYTASNQSRFQRLTYRKAYRKKSSSGLLANTSVVNHKFFTPEFFEGQPLFLHLSWPVHLHFRKDIYFDLKNQEIYEDVKNIRKEVVSYFKSDIDTILNECSERHYSGLHISFTNAIEDFSLKRKDMMSMPIDDINRYMTLADMITTV